MNTCATCGSENIKKLTNQNLDVSFKTSSKVKKFTLSGLSFEKCLDCGEIYFSLEDIEIKEQKLNEFLVNERKKKGLLTAQEIKEIRASLGYSQDQLDKLLGFGARSFARWETYRADQSKAADLLLRALKSGGKPLLETIINEQTTKDAA